MSKYGTPKFYRLITKQRLVSLVLYSLALSQTGYIFDLGCHSNLGNETFSKSDAEIVSTEASAVQPIVLACIRKSSYRFVSTKLHDGKASKNGQECNVMQYPRARVRSEAIRSDRALVKDRSQAALQADDLFTHSKTLVKPEPKVESGPLQMGPLSSSRIKTRKKHRPELPAIYARSFDLPEIENAVERQFAQSKHTESPASRAFVTPSPRASHEAMFSETPGTLVLRAETGTPNTATNKTIATEIDQTTSINDKLVHPAATPPELDVKIKINEELGATLKTDAPASKTIKLTARPNSHASREISYQPTAAQLTFPLFLNKAVSLNPTVVRSVVVETFDLAPLTNQSTDAWATRSADPKDKTPSLDDSRINSVLVAELPSADRNESAALAEPDSQKAEEGSRQLSPPPTGPSREARSVLTTELEDVLKPHSQKR